MNFRHPLEVVTPTLDGGVLTVLAGTTSALTGREVARALGLKSHDGVRRVLARLAEQGIVLRQPVGRAVHYRLNRDHLAAASIEDLAGLRMRLVDRMRSHIERWRTPPTLAVLFGSAARGEGSPTSDLDVLVIRPRGLDPDDTRWRDQLQGLERDATRWTGNDTRLLEFGQEEVAEIGEQEPVLRAAADEGIELYGSLHVLRRAVRRVPRR